MSETFIADHARTLAPDQTVLVCQDSVGSETYGYPVLSHIAPKPTSFGRVDSLAKTTLFKLRRRMGIELPYDDRMRLISFFNTHKVNCVMAEYGPIGLMVQQVCTQLGLPLFVYFHGNDASALLRQDRFRTGYKRMLPSVAGVFAASQHLIDNLSPYGCPLDRSYVIPCGSDISSFSIGSPVPGRIFALGRLVNKKAPHLTIRAFARIAASHPKAHLDIVGDGPLRAQCEAEISSADLADRVTLHGARQRQYWEPMMQRASIFAQHSITAEDGDTEGSPVAVTEAMATAVPVVATRHGGIIRQVEEGQTGYLVDEFDVSAMADAFDRLLQNPEKARKMGLAGRDRAEKYLDQKILINQMRRAMNLPDSDATIRLSA